MKTEYKLEEFYCANFHSRPVYRSSLVNGLKPPTISPNFLKKTDKSNSYTYIDINKKPLVRKRSNTICSDEILSEVSTDEKFHPKSSRFKEGKIKGDFLLKEDTEDTMTNENPLSKVHHKKLSSIELKIKLEESLFPSPFTKGNSKED